MSIRCGCFNEGDDIVFGPVHECSVNPDLSRRKPVYGNPFQMLYRLSQQDFTLSPPEPRYMETLGEDETHD